MFSTLKVLNYLFYEKKWCKKCKSKLQKWGKNRDGSQRYFCKKCVQIKTRKRPEIAQINHKKIFINWLLGKQSLAEIAQRYAVTNRTLNNWFTPFWNEEPLPEIKNIADQVLIIDGKYVDKNSTVLIGTVNEKVIFWLFVQRENYSTWKIFLSSFKHIPFAIVGDGQRGMLKAIRELFPSSFIQRCQFHVIKYCLGKLTQNPESSAGQELRFLVIQISKIKSKEQFKLWFEDYLTWRKTYHDFIKEKTFLENYFTPTGKRSWHYTHQNLHASYSHLKNAFPNLFRYLQYSKIPNTSNFVEGAVNSQMQEKLRFHRGLKLPKRKILIAHFLSSKQ